jgi:hypothetical protein
MAKSRSFEDKVRKAGMIFGKVCPICKEELSYVKRVEPVKRGEGRIGFSETVVAYCKCNIKQALEA